MIGREEQKENDLFFVCALIDYISRKTKNRRRDVVNQLGRKTVNKIYHLADVYHSDNIDRVSDDFIKEAKILEGDFDNIKEAKFNIPTHWDMGKIYKRLILGASRQKNADIIDTLINVYNSFVSDKIDDYNSSFYYDAPQNILNAYLTGIIE